MLRIWGWKGQGKVHPLFRKIPVASLRGGRGAPIPLLFPAYFNFFGGISLVSTYLSSCLPFFLQNYKKLKLSQEVVRHCFLGLHFSPTHEYFFELVELFWQKEFRSHGGRNLNCLAHRSSGRKNISLMTKTNMDYILKSSGNNFEVGAFKDLPLHTSEMFCFERYFVGSPFFTPINHKTQYSITISIMTEL